MGKNDVVKTDEAIEAVAIDEALATNKAINTIAPDETFDMVATEEEVVTNEAISILN